MHESSKIFEHLVLISKILQYSDFDGYSLFFESPKKLLSQRPT